MAEKKIKDPLLDLLDGDDKVDVRTVPDATTEELLDLIGGNPLPPSKMVTEPPPEQEPIPGVRPGDEREYKEMLAQEDRRDTAHLMMPTVEVDRYREYDRGSKESATLQKAIEDGGGEILQPLWISTDGDTGMLVEGNHRLAIAKAKGIEQLPVRVTIDKEVQRNQGRDPVKLDPTLKKWVERKHIPGRYGSDAVPQGLPTEHPYDPAWEPVGTEVAPVAEPNDSAHNRIVGVWQGNEFDAVKDELRRGGREAQTEGYDGIDGIGWKLDKQLKDNKALMGKEIVAKAVHSEPTKRELYRGVKLDEEAEAKLEAGQPISMPLSSFAVEAEEAEIRAGFIDTPAKQLRAFGAWESLDAEGIPVVLALEPGAKVASMNKFELGGGGTFQAPLRPGDEAVAFGQFDILDVDRSNPKVTRAKIRQTSMVEADESAWEPVGLEVAPKEVSFRPRRGETGKRPSRSYSNPDWQTKIYEESILDYGINEGYANAVKDINHRVNNYVRAAYISDPSFITDHDKIDRLTALMMPAVEAGQLQVADLTNAHLSNLFGVEHPPASQLSMFARPGVDKQAELARPFWTAVKESKKGKPLEEALKAGERRLGKMVDTDLQMAKVRQSREVLKAGHIQRYARVTGPKPCWLCSVASTQTYYTEDLLPIHPGCDCSVKPVPLQEESLQEDFDPEQLLLDTNEQTKMMGALIEDGAGIRQFRDRVAVRQHGEIGPTLTWKHQNFTGPDQVAALEMPRPNRHELAARAYENAKNHGGITIDLAGEEPSEGYAYAPLKDTETSYSMDEFKPEHVEQFIDTQFEELEKPGNHLGLWKQDDRMYIDVSRVGVPAPGTIEVAQSADQLAVFDLKNFEEINIGRITDGEYAPIAEATDLHNQHRRQVEAADESRSPASTSALSTGSQPAAAVEPPLVDPPPADYSYTVAKSLLTDARYSPVQTPGQEIPLRHGIGGDSTDAQMDAEAAKYDDLSDEQKAAARARADEIFELNSTQAAPARDEMRSIATDLGGIMEREFDRGVPTAVKTRSSTYRKVMKAQSKDNIAPQDYTLGDGIRFTVSFPEDSYWESTRALSGRMRGNGYEVMEGPNGWALHTYRGQNMKFSKDGVIVEVQTHTPYSVYTAEVNHRIYEKTRDPAWDRTTPQKVKDQWAGARRHNVESIPVPRRLPMMDEKDGPTSFYVGDETRIVLVGERTPVKLTGPIPKGGTPGDFPQWDNPRSIAAELHARHPNITVKFDKADPVVAHETARAIDDLANKYPITGLRGVVEQPMSSYRFAETGVPGVLDPVGRRDPLATEIRINPVFSKDEKALNKEYAKTLANGHHPPIGDHPPAYAVATHEYAHSLDAGGSYRASQGAEDALIDAWRASKTDQTYWDWVGERLSGYSFQDGLVHPTEAVAEAFAHVELEPETANEAERVLHDLVVRSAAEPPLEAVTKPQWKMVADSKSPAQTVAEREVARAGTKRTSEVEAIVKQAEVIGHDVVKASRETAAEKTSRAQVYGDKFVKSSLRDEADRGPMPAAPKKGAAKETRAAMDVDKIATNVESYLEDLLKSPEGQTVWDNAKNWYHEKREIARALIDGTDVPLEKALGYIACFSNRTAWADNITDATNFIHNLPHRLKDPNAKPKPASSPWPLSAVMDENMRRAERVKNSKGGYKGVLNAIIGKGRNESHYFENVPKLSRFFTNLSGGHEYLTIDTWMGRVARLSVEDMREVLNQDIARRNAIIAAKNEAKQADWERRRREGVPGTRKAPPKPKPLLDTIADDVRIENKKVQLANRLADEQTALFEKSKGREGKNWGPESADMVNHGYDIIERGYYKAIDEFNRKHPDRMLYPDEHQAIVWAWMRGGGE